jgi:hypothetical protein
MLGTAISANISQTHNTSYSSKCIHHLNSSLFTVNSLSVLQYLLGNLGGLKERSRGVRQLFAGFIKVPTLVENVEKEQWHLTLRVRCVAYEETSLELRLCKVPGSMEVWYYGTDRKTIETL